MDANTGNGRNAAENARASLTSNEAETSPAVDAPQAEVVAGGAEEAPVEVDDKAESKPAPKKSVRKKVDPSGLPKSFKKAKGELSKKAVKDTKLAAALEATAPKPRGRPKAKPEDLTPDQWDRVGALARSINALAVDDVQSKLGLSDLLNEAGAILKQGFNDWATKHLQF